MSRATGAQLAFRVVATYALAASWAAMLLTWAAQRPAFAEGVRHAPAPVHERDPNYGACCVDMNCIGTLTAEDCVAMAGTWYYGIDCTSFPCPIWLPGLPETCAAAYECDGLPLAITFTNTPAGPSAPAGSCNAAGVTVMQNDVWFRYTAPHDGTLTVQAFQYYNGLVAIYGGSCESLVELHCLHAGDAEWPRVNRTSLPVTAGTTTWLQVGDYGVNPEGGTTLLTLQCASAVLAGDLNCDGAVSFGDINPFVLVLVDAEIWQEKYPACPLLNGDLSGDGAVDFADINPFVDLLSALEASTLMPDSRPAPATD